MISWCSCILFSDKNCHVLFIRKLVARKCSDPYGKSSTSVPMPVSIMSVSSKALCNCPVVELFDVWSNIVISHCISFVVYICGMPRTK